MTVRPPPIDRRRFLEIGATASLAAALAEFPAARASPVAPGRLTLASGRSAAAASPQRAGGPEPGRLRPHAVIYDERFEAARRFAARVRRVPVPAHAMRGDVTQLWYSHLYPLWKRTPVPIGGLTAYAAMFCLERLAWDRELRMVRCVAGKADHGSPGWWMERASMVAQGFRASWIASPRRGAVADGIAAAAAGPLHFWLIASPPQLAAIGA